jgi:hypothetical protein
MPMFIEICLADHKNLVSHVEHMILLVPTSRLQHLLEESIHGLNQNDNTVHSSTSNMTDSALRSDTYIDRNTIATTWIPNFDFAASVLYKFPVVIFRCR